MDMKDIGRGTKSHLLMVQNYISFLNMTKPAVV